MKNKNEQLQRLARKETKHMQKENEIMRKINKKRHANRIHAIDFESTTKVS